MAKTHEDSNDGIAERLSDLQQRRDRMAAELQDRDSISDAADQAEALQRTDELSALDDQIADVERELAGEENPDATESDGLPDGTEVVVRHSDGAEQDVRIVASVEAIARGDDTAATPDSPLGSALAGANAGDTVSYDTPDGERVIEVVAVNEPNPK